jgi:tetratricopeptide (TPR) repeat protein
MARNGRMQQKTPIHDLGADRLSPAETHDVIRERLTHIAAQWHLKPVDAHFLARHMRARTYAPGEIIVPHGVRAGCLGLVVRGQVAVHVGQRASTRLVIVLLPGSTFGEAMLARGDPSHATLQALTPCEVRFLRRTDLQALSQERRAERQSAARWQLVQGTALLLAALIVLILALTLPPSRQALALAPMSLGQWCAENDHGGCTWRSWQVAANLAPSDPRPNLALGAYYFEQGNLAAAEKAFQTAQAIAPDSPEAYNNLGLIYARQGQHEQAIAAFQRALELEPGIAATEHNLGLSLQASQQYDSALLHYQAALALAEPQASTLVNMAIAYYETGQPEEAVQTAKESLRLDPDLAQAYTLLGAVALESRQPEAALPDLERAIALDAGYGPAYFYLGLAYKSMNQPDEAVTAFEQALVTATDDLLRQRVRRHLGELYEIEEQSRAQ